MENIRDKRKDFWILLEQSPLLKLLEDVISTSGVRIVLSVCTRGTNFYL